tara:strand:- start:333 stop:1013 length:681 start_codon:yes stop_codon:yes gene_type:complete
MKMTKTNDMGSHFLKTLVAGPAGSGKTRLCATTGAPGDTIIISAEGGLLSLREHNLTAIEVSTKDDVIEAYTWLCNSDEAKGIQWVCVDSLSEIAERVLSHEKEVSKDGRRAYGEMADTMAKLIRSFRDLPGKHVYMSCKAERIQTESGALLWAPSMPGNKLSQQIPYFFDEVAFLRVHRDDETGEIKRWLQCHPCPTYSAKDRSGALEMYEAPSLENLKLKILGE